MTVGAIPQTPRLWFGLRILVTVALCAILWSTASGPDVLRALANASPGWLALAVAALILQTMLSAQRWRVTAAQLGQRLTLGYAVREYFLSQAVNQSVPGAVVGDAARAVRARDRVGLMVASQAVVFERLAGQIAMFLTMAVAVTTTSLVPGGLDWPVANAGIVTTLAVCVATTAIAVLIAGRFPEWVRPLKRALFSRPVLPAQISFGTAITALNLAAFGFAARAVGVELGVIEVAALVPVILFAMLIPITISGWGLREGAAALILPIGGVLSADAVAASILFGLAMLISAAPGALILLGRR